MVDIIISSGAATVLFINTGEELYLGEVSTQWLDQYATNLREHGYEVSVEVL
jgi:hypothetical protein